MFTAAEVHRPEKKKLRHTSLAAIIMRTRSTFMSAQLDILPLLIPVMIDNWGVTDSGKLSSVFQNYIYKSRKCLTTLNDLGWKRP